MKLHRQETLRDDLYKAIEKVLSDHYNRGTFENSVIPPSHTEIVTNSAMATIINLETYYEELTEIWNG